MLLHICPATGCHELIPANQKYCSKHAKQAEQAEAKRQRKYDTTVRLVRDKHFHEFYLSKGWSLCKERVRSRYHGLCLWSWSQGRIDMAHEIHHVIPLKDDWDRRFAISNLIPLTHAAHMMIEQEYQNGHKAKMQKQLFDIIQKYTNEFGSAP